jgi:hypothetical protein
MRSFFFSNFSKFFNYFFFIILFFFQLKFCRPRYPGGHIICWPDLLLSLFGLGALSIGLIGIINFIKYSVFFFVFIVITIQTGNFLLSVIKQIPSLESRYKSQLCEILIQMKQHTVCIYLFICLDMYTYLYVYIRVCAN